MISFIWCSDQ